MIVPGPIAAQFAEIPARLDKQCPDIIAVWVSPERLARALPWREPNARMIDIQVFGEAALIVGMPRGGRNYSIARYRTPASSILAIPVAPDSPTMLVAGPPPGIVAVAAGNVDAPLTRAD